MLKLLYFAGLRELLNTQQEVIEYHSNETVKNLIERLSNERGQHWQVLFDPTTKVAVNHQMVEVDKVLGDGDEVAFFPPVTGG